MADQTQERLPDPKTFKPGDAEQIPHRDGISDILEWKLDVLLFGQARIEKLLTPLKDCLFDILDCLDQIKILLIAILAVLIVIAVFLIIGFGLIAALLALILFFILFIVIRVVVPFLIRQARARNP